MTDQAATHQATEPLIDPGELEAIIQEVLDALVMSAGVGLDEPIPPETGLGKVPIYGKIIVHADVKARLIIESDAQACATLARFWGLGAADGISMADASDALGELCNLVGATVKTVFDEESHVGVPEVAEGEAPTWAPEPVEVFHGIGIFIARFGLHP